MRLLSKVLDISKNSHPDVFISSTYEDLVDYRAAARDAALSCKCFPVMMEYWPAMDKKAVQECMAEIDGCDIYVGLYAHRYGHCPEDSDLSITELEFDRATQKGLKRLCFLLSEQVEWPERLKETEPGKAKLDKFKTQKLSSALIWKQFIDPKDFGSLGMSVVGPICGGKMDSGEV